MVNIFWVFLKSLKILIMIYLFIFLILLSYKMVFFSIFYGWSHGDTYEYFRIAKHILYLDFDEYMLKRTLGFPLFIALGGLNSKIIVVYQMLLGIAIALIVFYLIYDITKSRYLSLFTSILLGTYIQSTHLEFGMLTETLSYFLVTLYIFLVYKFFKTDKTLYIILASFVCGYLIIVKLNFIPTIISLIISIVYKRKFSKSLILTTTLISLMPLTINLFINYINAKKFSVYGYTGYSLLTHIANFSQCIGDYEIREKIRNRNFSVFWVWDIKWGKSEEEMRKIAIEAITKCPYYYFLSSFGSFLKFFFPRKTIETFSIERHKINFRKGYYRFKTLIDKVWEYQIYLNWFLNFLFFLILIFHRKSDLFSNVLSINILSNAIFQAFFIFGDNWRYGYPFLSSIVIYVVKNGYEFFKRV